MSDDHPRVGLNLLWLRPGAVGGTESYAIRVMRAILSHRPELSLHSFCMPEATRAHPTTIRATTVHEAPAGTSGPARRIAVERTWLARAAGDMDVVHHLGGTVPRSTPRPAVVTIHDLQPLDDPGNFSPVKRRWLALSIPAAVQRAAVVVTPSDWVRTSVIDRFGVDADRVVTVSAYARPIVSGGSPSHRVHEIVRRGPILLYPAMTMAHKNHRFLFDAFAGAAVARDDVQLVCVGSVGRDHEAIVEAARRASTRIHVLGHVAVADLSALMESAEAMVFPSRYEGFGLPVLEAQQAGVPVISSNAAALPEVGGGATIELDPHDLDGWIEALARPLPEARRRDLVERGRVNAERYTPQATAVAQLHAYRMALTGS